MIKIFVKLVIKNILSFMREAWYKIKLAAVNARLKVEKQEAKDAKENSDKLTTDFESEYAEYLRQQELDAMRRSTVKVCSDGGSAESDDKGTGGCDRGTGRESGTSGE